MASTNTNERTALLEAQSQTPGEAQNATHQEQTGLPGIIGQFEAALQEEDDSTTFVDILFKRPAAVILALSLFTLFIVVTTFFSSLRDPAVLDRLAKVPNSTPLGVSLVNIGSDRIDISTRASLELDFEPLGTGFTRTAIETLATKLGNVRLKFDEPINISVLSDDGNGEKQWHHLIDANTTEQLQVSMKPQKVQEFEILMSLTNVGRTNALGYVAKEALRNHPLLMRAKGVAVVAKYGLNIRVPFILTQDVQIPRQTTEDLAKLRKVEVNNHHLHGVNITALANTSIEFPVYGSLPGLDWLVKIPGCDEKTLEVLCGGHSHPLSLKGSDEVINLLFSSILENLPTQVTEPCYPESSNSFSPLDNWVRKYLAGELSTIWIEGVHSSSHSRIINELFTGYEVPYSIYGKPANEKLIEAVTFQDVTFSARKFVGIKKSLDKPSSILVSGKVVVDVVLPQFIEMKTKTAILVEALKGTIQLFDSENRHFAQILAGKQWLQTISLSSDTGYKVVCFFDNLPTEITDQTVFASVSSDLVLKGSADVHYDAIVDVKFDTTVGSITIKKTRIKGKTRMQA